MSKLPTKPRHVKEKGPLCYCKTPKPTVLKQVEESTTNWGAFYYKCETETCKFFKWATDSGKSIDYGDLWAPCCRVHPNRKCKLLQIARNSPHRGKLFWICGVLDKPCKYFELFEGDIEEYLEFVPNYDESLLESEEKEIEHVPIVMSQSNQRNSWVGQFPEEIMSVILEFLEMIPEWIKIIGVCKEWKRMIDSIIDQRVRDGLIELNLGFLHSNSQFSYFCAIFKRFYKVKKVVICNFALYSELMRLLEWVGVETLVLYNCTTKMSRDLNPPPVSNTIPVTYYGSTINDYEDSGKERRESTHSYDFRSKHTEMSFSHIHGGPIIYNLNPSHVNQLKHHEHTDLYADFIREMEKKIDTTKRRQFLELSQIIAINCSDLYFVWLNGDAKSYHKHSKAEGNFADLFDLPFNQDMESYGKCWIDVYSLPVGIEVGILNISLLGNHRKSYIYVNNGKKYGYPTAIQNQVIKHPEIQNQFIRKCGISKYFDKKSINIHNKENAEISLETGILTSAELSRLISEKQVHRRTSHHFEYFSQPKKRKM